MEEESPSRRSVAELAGRFRGSTPAIDAAENPTQEKPVRRRPPRSLQLPKTPVDQQEAPGVTSPLPAKAKRNSALIEKLQASLALSPSPQLPSPKSPGFRLLPPAFPPSSPGPVLPTTPDNASPATPASPITEEEGPSSFEAPPTVVEGSILSNINKSRARHSIRRRPPSRRHRKSSCGEEVAVANDEADNGPEGGGGEEEVTSRPEDPQIQKEDGVRPKPKEENPEEEVKDRGDKSPSGGDKEKTEEEICRETPEDDVREGARTSDDREGEKKEDTLDQSSAR